MLKELGFHKTAVFIPVPEYWAAKKNGFQLGRMIDAITRSLTKHDNKIHQFSAFTASPAASNVPISQLRAYQKQLSDKASNLVKYKNTLMRAQHLQLPKGIQN